MNLAYFLCFDRCFWNRLGCRVYSDSDNHIDMYMNTLDINLLSWISMNTFSAVVDLCEGNPLVIPIANWQSCGILMFRLLNILRKKQSSCRWFKALRRLYDAIVITFRKTTRSMNDFSTPHSILQGMWEGLTAKQLLGHGLVVSSTPPLQYFCDYQASDPSSFGNMTYTQIEHRFHQ